MKKPIRILHLIALWAICFLLPASVRAVDIIVDNADASGVGLFPNAAAWAVSTNMTGYYGANYLHDFNTGGGKSARFTPAIPTAGTYEVFTRWIAYTNRASNVPIDIVAAGGTVPVQVDQRSNGSTWVSLGRYAFNAGTGGSVLISNIGANGYVIADAVKFTPLVLNPGFEVDAAGAQTITGWSESGSNPTASFTSGSVPSHGGGAYLGHWLDTAYNVFTSQTRTGLPNGNYTLRAWVQRTNAPNGQTQTTAQMEASGYGGALRTAVIPVTSTWTQISITGINVTNGTCTFGFRSVSPAKANIRVDDVELVSGTDLTAPSVPTGLAATAVSSNQINLSWTASTDTGGSGLAGYRIYRNGSATPTATSATNSFSDTGLAASTAYTYRVKAYDNAGNESALSAQVGTTTLAGGGGTGQLSPGRWYPSPGTFFQSLYAVYPRPDSETAAYARHRKAYYDGVNPVPYEVEIGVQYGGWPYWYELTAGPAGMTVGKFYGDSDYGRVRWTPSGPVTNATVTVLVHDQDGNTLPVTWTVSTSSSTNDFIFVDAVNGNDAAGTGAIGTPYKTLLKIFGATEGNTTFPNRIAYLRAGTYAGYTQAGGYGFNLSPGKTPMALIGFPGETVQINMANSGSISAINATIGANDLFFKNLTFVGHPVSTNYYSIRIGELQHRLTFDDLRFPDAYQGSDAYNNSSSIYFNSPEGANVRNHIFQTRCLETNRGATGGGGNSWNLTCHFKTNRVLVQYCKVTGARRERSFYMKDSVAHCEIRECLSHFATPGVGILTGLQNNNGLNQGPYLYRHNRSNSGMAADESQASLAGPLIKQHYFVRNSCINPISMNGVASGSFGPYVVAENVIQTDGNLVRRNYSGSLPLGSYTITADNVGGASGWLDATTLNLQSAHLDVRGLRGAEIAP